MANIPRPYNPLSPNGDQRQFSPHHLCIITHKGHENLGDDHQR